MLRLILLAAIFAIPHGARIDLTKRRDELAKSRTHSEVNHGAADCESTVAGSVPRDWHSGCKCPDGSYIMPDNDKCSQKLGGEIVRKFTAKDFAGLDCHCRDLTDATNHTVAGDMIEDMGDGPETPNLALTYSFTVDSESTNFVHKKVKLFELKKGRDLFLTRLNKVDGHRQTSMSEEQHAKNVAAQLGVEGSYLAFSGKASMGLSANSSSDYKTSRTDVTVVSVMYRLISQAELQPLAYLRPAVKRRIQRTTGAEKLVNIFGEFFATGVDLGGKVTKSYIMEISAKDTALSVEAKIQAKYGGFIGSVEMKSEMSYDNSSSSKEDKMKERFSCHGGDPSVFLKFGTGPGSSIEELQKIWADSVNDTNLFPFNYKLRPIWALIEEVDPDKGAAVREFLQKKWKGSAPKPRSKFHEVECAVPELPSGADWAGGSCGIAGVVFEGESCTIGTQKGVKCEPAYATCDGKGHMEVTCKADDSDDLPPKARIENVNAMGKYLNVNGNSESNGANVHIYSNPHETSTQWRFHKVGGAADTYTIENENAARKYLNANGNQVSRGTNVHLWNNPHETSSQWRFHKVSGAANTYTIENVNAVGMYLNVDGNQVSNKASVQLWNNPHETSSQWRVWAI